jgi:hypothetical protein
MLTDNDLQIGINANLGVVGVPVIHDYQNRTVRGKPKSALPVAIQVFYLKCAR